MTPTAPTAATGPKFKVGDLVSPKASPGVLLPVLEVVAGGAERRYRVFENNAKATYYESQLQAPPAASDERRTLTPRELHARLTSLHALSPSTANLFSFRSGRVHFLPHQYRPVLKLIRADRPRLLIADEVGVGKTIEAALILKELRARMDLSSVLVICPKALVAERKWANEMKRFDEPFVALDGPKLRECLQETHVDGQWPAHYAKAILPFSLFDSELLFGSNGKKRTKVKSLLTLDPPPKFDLVIVDEAHHIRNASTYVHQGVRYFCDNAQAVVMLSATPVQLGSDDLLTLLNVLRPDLVLDRPSFEQMAEPNKHVSAAAVACRRAGPGWQRAALDQLDEAVGTAWGQRFIRPSQEYRDVRRRLEADALADADRVALTRGVEELHTFSRIINRTRRRDIGNFTTRKAETLPVEFTTEQRELHDGLLGVIQRIMARTHGGQNVKFMMTTVRRQAASCLYGLSPLLSDILARKLDRLEVLEATDGEDEIQEEPQFLEEIRSEVESLVRQAAALKPQDPKVEAFLRVLRDKGKRPNNKSLVFSTFRHTLRYLDGHVRREGLRVGLIHGDVPDEDRATLRRRFALPKEEPDAIDVLLSSEVGCEGLDFQFCDLLVNYDLPWNPMRIEQRIGRIDRYGQQSEMVVIVNLITPGTVDADIYDRCLSRIGVFEQSIGGSEEILGAVTRELHDIAESFTLNPGERAARLQQLADNSIRKLREEQELESQQAELFGLNVSRDAWRDEVLAADTFWLSPPALQVAVTAYLEGRAGEGEHLLGEKPLKTLRLGREARERLLEDFKRLPRPNEPSYREWGRWLEGTQPTLAVTFDQQTAADNPKAAHLSVIHPLVRQAARYLEIVEPGYASLEVTSDAVPTGSHFFAVYRWAKHGVKPDETLVAVAADPQVEEKLFTLLQSARAGSAPLPTPTECDALDERHHRRWHEAQGRHVADNRSLVEQRGQSLTASHNARRKVIEDQIARATEDKIRLMKQSELARADAEFDHRMGELRAAAGGGDIRAAAVLFGTITVTTGEHQ
ncbi:MAG: helicase-related protein [Gemmataceae bacterium]